MINLTYHQPVLVQLKRCDDHITRVDASRSSRTVGLVAVNAVDMNDPFFTINLGDLSISSLVFSSHDQHLIVLSYR